MDMTYLVQMRQSNKCGSVRNDKIPTYPCNLVQALESASPASCKTPSTFTNSICSSTRKNQRVQKWDSALNKSNCTVLAYCLGPPTQNLGLRELDLKPSHKKNSDTINMLKQGRNTPKNTSHIEQSELIYVFRH